jgi:small subunit ribosomal protein S17
MAEKTVALQTHDVTKKRTMTGQVISDKMDKTVVVKIVRDFQHPVFKKVVRRAKNYKVHDEQEQAKAGDIVEIYEGRPVSKTKYMYLSRIIRASSI